MTQGVAFVTGGGSGIGRAAAVALAGDGLAIAVSDADLDRATETVQLVEERGGQAFAVLLDVCDEAAVDAAVQETVERYGRLDVAVNSAGIQGDLAAVAECTLANWERTLAVNLTGTFLCMRAEINAMLAGGGGSVINLASNFGLVGKPRIPAYVASKHGVVGLTKSAALDYAQRGIRVNAVCPGPIDTPLLRKIAADAGPQGEAMRREVEESVPMGRVGESDEVAQVIGWLASPAASFVTGTAIPVDGGFVVG
ncbi:MAG: 3-oxoacyl-[acyl-carrier protein] reductase [Nocardioides sp.]|jgi:NAD(P)-dependent dehydrogenase (short-subunit alcohol dehydrogenase family)|nr:3-oxoacyl-[acyl-carrier protein] reductase [Nocardioides sp.]